ncbi:hypothetical protein GMDG_06797 [Pseudogymnoascus destructans 20631-21]|uniref:Secreted protein n=1 Tax=Pseudogymnoascus destructans (strain ATCC MYA-4855 / 20631-21) TaxID=658429 RepID=L8FU50_PSED2|nr:hypothetical protein GMDG_06797 [Pseudogymnoascus destructans 20631-21]
MPVAAAVCCCCCMMAVCGGVSVWTGGGRSAALGLGERVQRCSDAAVRRCGGAAARRSYPEKRQRGRFELGGYAVFLLIGDPLLPCGRSRCTVQRGIGDGCAFSRVT